MFRSNFLFLVLNIFFSINILFCQPPTRDSVKEQIIENQLKDIKPSLVSIFKAGTIALDEGNYQLADSLYTIVFKKAPIFDPVIRRLGIIKCELSMIDSGVKLCEKAVSINKSAYNLSTLASCLLRRNNIINSKNAMDLLRVAQTLPDGNDPDITIMMGQAALQSENIDELRTITSTLLNSNPNLSITHYFASIVAIEDKRWQNAIDEIKFAKSLGMPDESVNGLLKIIEENKSDQPNFTYYYYFLWIFGIWIFGLIILYLIGLVLSNMTLKSIESNTVIDTSNKNVKLIRSIYKFFINAGGIYYYLSLPIILIILIGTVIGLVYVFIYIGRIPIKLMAILIIGSCISIYYMIKSIIIKVDYSDPGRILKNEEAPDLYRLVRDVAKAINTRPVDEIRITPGTDLAVYERGNWKKKLNDSAERILVLGVGILKDFNQSEFQAVLAHEYGHFSNRDTAGGEMALKVMNDMNKYVYAIYATGQNVWWNISFHFLRIYNFIYRRISHGSIRLQEVLADQVAAKMYGNLAFQNGLKYVIKRDIEFNFLANQEIEEAQNAKRLFSNLYEIPACHNATIEEQINQALTCQTSKDDTHPSPIDRIKYISNVNSKNIDFNDTKVIELFLNWEEITIEMTNLIQTQINQES